MQATILDAMKSAMNDVGVWKTWQIPKEIDFLHYIGDSLPSLANNTNGGGGANGGIDNTNSTATNGTGGALGTTHNKNNNGLGLALKLGLGIPAALLLLLLILMARKKRDQMTAREFHALMNSEFVLNGTADPPGSFHEGLYHYMPQGTRYLSTRCEGCLETRRNSFFTDHNLAMIPEGKEFEENILISANSKDLAGRASTMDVHKCASANCERCNNKIKGTTFLSSCFREARQQRHHELNDGREMPEHIEV
jgi:hypothetical protein